VADEEMFQGRQRYCEEIMRNFMDKYGWETEKSYLQNIQGVGRIVGVAHADGRANKKLKDDELQMLKEEEEEAEQREIDQEAARKEAEGGSPTKVGDSAGNSPKKGPLVVGKSEWDLGDTGKDPENQTTASKRSVQMRSSKTKMIGGLGGLLNEATAGDEPDGPPMFNLAGLGNTQGKQGANAMTDGPKKSNIQLIIEKQERDREEIRMRLLEQEEEKRKAALGIEQEGTIDPKKKKMIQLSEYSVAGNILKNSKRKAIVQTGQKDRVNFDIDGGDENSDDD
jgi:hypothetical protein